MISPDPMSRPNASRLVTLVALRTNGANSKSRSQLYKELRETRTRLKLLEQELENEKRAAGPLSQKASASPEFPTPPKDKETTPNLISPIALASTCTTNQPATNAITNLNACISTRSKDCSQMVSATNTPSIGKTSQFIKVFNA